MLKYFIVAVLLLSPAASQAAGFAGLAKTDPALAAAFNAALVNLPAVPAASRSLPVSGETRAAYPSATFVPLHRGGVYNYEYTSSEFTGAKALRLEYGAYSAKDQSVNVTLTVFNRTKPWTTTFKVYLAASGVMATGSPLGGARLEMPAEIVYNMSWDENGDRSRVAAVRNSVTAGGVAYKDCVRIVTRLAGGDAGTVNRYYAPGVGLVVEQLITGEKQESITLLSYRLN